MVNEFYVAPRRNTLEFMPFIMDLTVRKAVDVIYPIPTSELEMFAARREKFESQGQRMVSSLESLKTANNKGSLFQWMERQSLPSTPHFQIVKSWDELESAAYALGYPDRRVCFKPPFSTGSQGFRVLDTKADCLTLLLYANPTSTWMNLDELAAILESADPFPPLVVMEYLPEDGYDVDVLALEGKSLCVTPRRNQSMWYGMSLICTTELHARIMMMNEQIVASLRLSYVLSLCFKLGANAHAKIIEINPRIPGSIISATMAGVNMPYLAVKLALGENVEIPQVRWGRQMIRYWEEMFLSPEGELLKPISNG
jgi:carbamoyl-phosphate synthase large subunit